MPLIGSAIKKFIDLRYEFNPNADDARELQRRELKRLLEKARHTAFGIYHGFEELMRNDQLIAHYQEEVPVVTYEEMHERWWRQQQRLPNITWPGKPDYFALTSATTGSESKRIPVTNDLLASIRSVGTSQLISLANFDLNPQLFEKEILMLTSSAHLERNENGFLEGEISGINAYNIPNWMSSIYRPGPKIAATQTWEERVEAIIKEAPNWDIAGIAGIPSWMQLLFKRIIQHHNLKNIHDIWPNLTVFATGGVAFEPYLDTFEKLTARPLTFMDTFLASEGFFAYNARPDTTAMKLAVEHGMFFEFIPFDERGFDAESNLLHHPLALTVDQIEEDTEYALVVSTCAGSWRYMIGDTVKFTDKSRQEIVISGRTKHFLNVVGSQLSEEKLNAAVRELSERLAVNINEFSVCALKDEEGEFYHQWVLGCDSNDIPTGNTELEEQLDKILQASNKNYAVARSKALKYIKVKAAPASMMYDWLEKIKKKGGQVKMPKVSKPEQMRDLMAFIKHEGS